jgi:hypothetical protein
MQDGAQCTFDVADVGIVKNGTAMSDAAQVSNGIVDRGHCEFLVSGFASDGSNRREAEAAFGGPDPASRCLE